MQITDEMVRSAWSAWMDSRFHDCPDRMRAALEAALGASTEFAKLKDEHEAMGRARCDDAACIEDLAGALKNFAMIEMPSQEPDHWPIFGKKAGMGWPIVGDFRVARATLEKWGLK